MKPLHDLPGTVGDRCTNPRCRREAALRYVGADLCLTHWHELCDRLDERATDDDREIDNSEEG